MKKIIYNKGQITIEFISVIGFLFVVTIVLVHGILVNVQTQISDESYEELKSVGNFLKNEIMVASEVHDGYSKKVILPPEIFGQNYSIITFKNNWIILVTDKTEFVINTNYFEGNISKNNTINKINGTVIFKSY